MTIFKLIMLMSLEYVRNLRANNISHILFRKIEEGVKI